MNFLTAVQEGVTGVSEGLPYALSKLNSYLGGIHRKMYYIVAAEAKAGKTSFVNENFLIEPFLYSLQKPEMELEFWYWATEMDLIEIEASVVSNLIYRFKNLRLSREYILGRTRTSSGQRIIVPPEHISIIEDVYEEYIVPMFGRHDERGKLTQQGAVRFFQVRENPTGIYNTLMARAAQLGTFEYESIRVKDDRGNYVEKLLPIAYNYHNPNKRIIVIVDHMRGLKREQGFKMKENIDKMSEYFTDLRNLTGMTIVGTIHSSRAISDVNRLKLMRDKLYLTDDDVKDSGNPVEDANVLFTMLNASDEKYGIKNHFGYMVEAYSGRYRCLSIVRARNAACPQHLGLQFFGDIHHFNQI